MEVSQLRMYILKKLHHISFSLSLF